MNITNTMCRLSELTQEQIDSLVDAMPASVYLERGWYPEQALGFDKKGNSGFWNLLLDSKIVTYKEMMQLLGKTMEFTKSDLIKLAQSETVFVKQRDDNYGLALKDYAASSKHFHLYSDIDDNLIHSTHKSLDIMAVYKTLRIRCLDAHLNGQDLTLIWERTEQTPAQKELALLQEQITALQEQAKVLQAKL
jgi:hypothetical protein